MPERMQFETVPITELIAKGMVPDSAQLPIVLVVDDEHVIADSLAAILRGTGFAAFAVYNAESALEFIENVTPDLMITDVMMPGMNGVDLAIAVTEASPACKVLLFSGQASTADLLSAARDQGHDFSMLAKPVHPADLLAHISRMMP